MFGLRAFFRLAIGDVPQEVQEASFLQHSLGTLINAPAAQPQKFDAPAALKSEADNLELAMQKSVLDDVEKRLLGARYPKKKVSKGKNAGDDIFGFTSTTKKNKVSKK